jgi:hypothetical protein
VTVIARARRSAVAVGLQTRIGVSQVQPTDRWLICGLRNFLSRRRLRRMRNPGILIGLAVAVALDRRAGYLLDRVRRVLNRVLRRLDLVLRMLLALGMLDAVAR